MTGRDEICRAFDCLITTLQSSADPNSSVNVKGEVIVIGKLLEHARALHIKLVNECEKTGGGDTMVLTRSAYKALIAKVSEADRIIAANAGAEVSAGEEGPS